MDRKSKTSIHTILQYGNLVGIGHGEFFIGVRGSIYVIVEASKLINQFFSIWLVNYKN